MVQGKKKKKVETFSRKSTSLLKVQSQLFIQLRLTTPPYGLPPLSGCGMSSRLSGPSNKGIKIAPTISANTRARPLCLLAFETPPQVTETNRQPALKATVGAENCYPEL